MAPLNAPIIDSPRSDLILELRSFIYGVTRNGLQNALELTKIAVNLLKTCPAARDAVFEFFSMVFHDAVTVFMNRSDIENETGPTNQSIESCHIISPALCEFDEAWAPILAPWSITLLKDIAGSNANFSRLQNCDSVRSLLSIATVSLTRLKESERAMCIDMMLGSSQCDWVIGHLGRCDASLVVPRALELGLQNDTASHIDHVVGIITHLSPLHFDHVRQALLSLFQDSLKHEPSANIQRKQKIIPYLLHLASKSETVLKALSQNIEDILTPNVIDRLSELFSMPCDPGNVPSSSLLVSLCLKTTASVFMLLLQWAKTNTYCHHLLEYLLQQMEEGIRTDELKESSLISSISQEFSSIRCKLVGDELLDQYSVARVSILIGYLSPTTFINTVSYLLQNSTNDRTLAILVRIMSGALSMKSSVESNEHAIDSDRNVALIREAVEVALKDVMLEDDSPHISLSLLQKEKVRNCSYLEQFCNNITTLLKWESSGKVSKLRNRLVTKACEGNLYRLTSAFNDRVSLFKKPSFQSDDFYGKPCNDMSTCHSMARMFDYINFSTNTAQAETNISMKIMQANVKYFFRCLHEKDFMVRMKGIQFSYKMFKKICTNSKVARSFALRELLETAMFRETETFGGKRSLASENNENFDRAKDELLIFQNQKHGIITQLVQSHTSVFHAGIIGGGARKVTQSSDSKESMSAETLMKIELLMGALMACMDGNGGVVEGMTCVSLLLVELISPDVMYNGLPWPDEDFTKEVSIERELYMKAALGGCPSAKAALRRAATSPPALSFSSALLRATAATLMHQHAANSHQHTEDGNLNKATIELLELMSLGQLLPPPLNYISEMIPHLKSNEIVQVLRDCIWNYTRDHVPSPALFTCDASGLHWREPTSCRPPSLYTDTLRVLIQRNISILGHLYPLMFLRLGKEENGSSEFAY